MLKAGAERVVAAEGRKRQAGFAPNPEFQFGSENLRPGQTYTRDVDTVAFVTWPLDIFGKPIGGLSSLETGIELRTRITDTIGIANFLEGGTVYDKSFPQFNKRLFWGTGIGVRYYSPLGPVRFDIATPLHRRHQDGLVQVYISLGQAF